MSISNSVTEKGVTVTASAPVEEIRDSAGFSAVSAPVASESSLSADPGEVSSLPSSETATETTPTEPERHDDGTFKAKPKDGDPRKSFQAKINEERRLRGDAERRAAELEAKLAAGTLSRPEAAGKPTASDTTQPPTYVALVKRYQSDPEWPTLTAFVEAGFDDPYAACNAAQAAFLQDKRSEEVRQETARTQAQESERQRIMAAHEAGAEKYADWGELFASDAAQIDLPAAVLQEIYRDSTLSADVIYHLLTHPKVLEPLLTITDPIAAARAITTLAVGLSSAPSGPETAPKPTTRAKPLIKPVSASPAAPEAASVDDLPFGPRFVRETVKQEKAWKDAHRGV